MIVAKCPLRISLVGGGTDHPAYLGKYAYGSVISFPSSLSVYASVNYDVDGLNHAGNYVLNYSKREEVRHVQSIQNELIRTCLEAIDTAPLYLSLTSDVASHGSGLASSSAYTMAMVAALRCLVAPDRYKCELPDPYRIAQEAMLIERTLNPLVGQQDFYGSCEGGLKRLDFYNVAYPTVKKYVFDERILRNFKMYLVPTSIRRDSTEILKSVNIDKCHEHHMEDVERMERALLHADQDKFIKIINDGWEHKKATSPQILQHPDLVELDKKLENDRSIIARKLCGAGNGGYFLIFQYESDWYNSQTDPVENYNAIPVEISQKGLTIAQL